MHCQVIIICGENEFQLQATTWKDPEAGGKVPLYAYNSISLKLKKQKAKLKTLICGNTHILDNTV